MEKYSGYIISAFLLVAMLISGCGDDNNPVAPEKPSTGLSSLVIQDNLSAAYAGYNIKFIWRDNYLIENILGASSIDRAGNYKLIIGEASSSKCQPLNNFVISGFSFYQGDLFISDTTARYLTGRLFVYNNSDEYAEIMWFNRPSVRFDQLLYKSYENIYCFFNKDLEMKGSITSAGTNPFVYKFNFEVKAGWNILTRELYIDYISEEIIISYTNLVPSNSDYRHFELKRPITGN